MKGKLQEKSHLPLSKTGWKLQSILTVGSAKVRVFVRSQRVYRRGNGGGSKLLSGHAHRKHGIRRKPDIEGFLYSIPLTSCLTLEDLNDPIFKSSLRTQLYMNP